MIHEHNPGIPVLPRPRPVPSRQFDDVLLKYTGWGPTFTLRVEETSELMSLATIYVPKDAMVFIVEDDANRVAWFVKKLGMVRIYGIFDAPEQAITHLNAIAEGFPKLENICAFFLDHDLGGPYKPPYSTDIAKRMAEIDPQIGLRTVIHSANEPGARNLQAILPGAVYFPFGFFDIQNAPEKP